MFSHFNRILLVGEYISSHGIQNKTTKMKKYEYPDKSLIKPTLIELAELKR
jgi:hypothetical protein